MLHENRMTAVVSSPPTAFLARRRIPSRSLPFVVSIAPSEIATAVTRTYGLPFDNDEAGLIGFCYALPVQQVKVTLPDAGCCLVSCIGITLRDSDAMIESAGLV